MIRKQQYLEQCVELTTLLQTTYDEFDLFYGFYRDGFGWHIVSEGDITRLGWTFEEAIEEAKMIGEAVR